MRIVSLLPSATEILFALGAGDEVVGVTFECDFPPEARERTVVSTSTLPEQLARLQPDLVVTQALCAVCAVDQDTVTRVLHEAGCAAEIVTLHPHTIDEVLATFSVLGAAVGRPEAAAALVAEQRQHLAAVLRWSMLKSLPRVMYLEWVDPPFAPGYWIPEMIQLAGGEPVMGRRGEASFRTDWDAIRATDPDVIVVGPCGFDLAAAEQQAEQVRRNAEVPGARVIAVDANAAFARPGPRLADGVEQLALLLHNS